MVITLGMVALAMFCALTAVVVGLRQRPEKVPVPPGLLALELARLAEHVRAVEGGNQPRKAERLAAALRANLRRRKEQARASSDQPKLPTHDASE